MPVHLFSLFPLPVESRLFEVKEPRVPATITYDSSGSNVDGRSVYGDSLDTMTYLCCGNGNAGNFMIRAEIDPIVPPGAPVGGFLEPVNKLVVFAPYLALFGVIGAVAVVFRKRPDN